MEIELLVSDIKQALEALAQKPAKNVEGWEVRTGTYDRFAAELQLYNGQLVSFSIHRPPQEP